MADKSDHILSFNEGIIQQYIKRRRPPEAIRDQVDIGYTFEDHVLIIFTIRPSWRNKEEKLEIPVAKSRYINSKGIWKIYWQRANGKWISYDPNPEVKDISSVLKIIEEDVHGCFWG